MWQLVLDFLFPKRSLAGSDGEWITAQERSRLQIFPKIFEEEELRRMGLQWIDRLVAASSYRDSALLRKAVHTYKYRGVRDLTAELSSLLLSMKDHLRPGAVLCPVPLHWSRKFARGFNQAQVLALSLSKETGRPLKNLLTRVRPTGHQMKRNRDERFAAVADAFRFQKGQIAPQSVVLIDDVFTTGATLDMCAKALKKNGVSRVEAMVLAHD